MIRNQKEVVLKKNQQLANKLHKPIIRKFKKRKVYSSFKDNILAVDLADMQLVSKCNKELDIFYVLLIPKYFKQFKNKIKIK